MMIDAFSSVIQKYPDYKLVIYGEGELRPELEQLIKEYKLENSVYLPGVKKDIHQYIKDAEMFLLTSKFEGMPNALIEAMCLGLPCISTKVSGAVDLIKNGENGLLVDLDDTEELIANIEKIIEDNEYAFELGKKASFLNEELSVARIADKWLNTITCKIKNN